MTGVAPAGEVVFFAVLGLVLLGVVIRVAVAPLLAELRSLRVDLASGLALDRRARPAEKAPAP